MAATPQCLSMVIEALMNGNVFGSQEVLDHFLQDVDGYSPRENFEFRENLIRLHLNVLQQKMEKIFNPGIQVEYRLVFSSKVNPDYVEQD
jgi:hypothetical protein